MGFALIAKYNCSAGSMIVQNFHDNWILSTSMRFPSLVKSLRSKVKHFRLGILVARRLQQFHIEQDLRQSIQRLGIPSHH